MNKIKELTDKYYVLKIDDVLRFGNDKEIKQFNDFSKKIALRRREEGKGGNHYLVLNMEDEAEINHLLDSIDAHRPKMKSPYIAIKDIAVDIINAILEAGNP